MPMKLMLMAITACVLILSYRLVTSEWRPAASIYDNINSFSCARFQNQEVQFSWSDDPVGTNSDFYSRSKFRIVLIVELPKFDITNSSEIEFSRSIFFGYKLLINGTSVPIKKISTTGLGASGRYYHAPNIKEFASIKPAVERNFLPCMKQSYLRVDLDDELN